MILERIGGALEATHSRPRLVIAPHPAEAVLDAFWLVGGRLVDHATLGADEVAELRYRTQAALRREGQVGELAAHVPPGEVDEVRIIQTWLASHPETPQLSLRPTPDHAALAALLQAARSRKEGQLHDDRLDLVGADGHM